MSLLNLNQSLVKTYSLFLEFVDCCDNVVYHNFEKAHDILEKLIKTGTGEYSRLAHVLRFDSTPTVNDLEWSIATIKNLAGKSNAIAMTRLASWYERGIHVPINPQEAVRLYSISAIQGYADAQFNLGKCYEAGYMVELNIKEAVRLFKLAAKKGNANAQHSLGRYYECGQGVEMNLKTAFRFYKLAAKQGHAMAQCDLGRFYELGYGVEKNIKKAIRFYKLATYQGYAPAQHALEFNYLHGFSNGIDTENNLMELAKLYRYLGDKTSLDKLGRCYEYGYGVELNLEKAFELYKHSADLKYAVSQYNLGRCYEYGYGVKKNLEEAFRLYNLSANQGNSLAINKLEKCYRKGIGTEQNFVRSLRQYSIYQKYDVPTFPLSNYENNVNWCC